MNYKCSEVILFAQYINHCLTFILFQSSTEVVITIKDVNDNPMRFKLSNYRGHILENSSPGTKIVLVSIVFN